MDQKLKFQSKEYQFPKSLWFNYYFAHRADYGVIPFTLYVTNLTKKKAFDTAQEVIGQFAKSEKASLLPTVLIVKLEYHSLFPLKSEYWQKPEFEIDRTKEIETLFQALHKPDLYYFIVTPSYSRDGNKEETMMGLGMATLKTAKDDIHLWMRNSTMPVINDAKHAAFYELQTIYASDKTGSLNRVRNINNYVDLGFGFKKTD